MKQEIDKLLDKVYKKKIEETREKNCFDAEWNTYVYCLADSYAVKETLKQYGFRYHPILKWHIAAVPDIYADSVVKIRLQDIGQLTSYGKIEFFIKAGDIVKDLCAASQPAPAGNYVGEQKSRIKDYPVYFIESNTFEGYYGTSTCYTFNDDNGNTLTWMTTTTPDLVEGEHYLMSAGIKSHKVYQGKKVTYVNRCKFIRGKK